MGTIGKRRNKEEERKKEWKNDRKGLTLTGLLMEGIAHRDKRDRVHRGFQAAFSSGVLMSRSGRHFFRTVRKSCRSSSMVGRPKNQ